MKDKENKKIKIIALDLDGTTLKGDNHISPRTTEAIKRAMDKGVHVVIATGRTFKSLPDQVFHMEGLEYIITSNGAHITRLKDMKLIYENTIAGVAVEKVVSIARELPYIFECFVEGTAYIMASVYEEMEEKGCSYRDVNYVLSTRHKVKDIYDFTIKNKDKIENISITFPYEEDRKKLMKIFHDVSGITLTSSFEYNIEIGGTTTSKGEALKFLMKELELGGDCLMACGDSPNDEEMLKLASVAIAMDNALPSVKEKADYITDHHKEDGVAKAIEKFVL